MSNDKQQIAQIKTNHLAQINNNLKKRLSEKLSALPERFNSERFLHNCMAVIKSIDNIEKTDSTSVAQALFKGAVLDLDFFQKECYVIPYWNKETNMYEMNFQTDYKGEEKVVKRFAVKPVENFYTGAVREGDEFEYGIDRGKPYVNFKPKSFNDGDFIGFFAICLYKDGSMEYEPMSVAEVDEIKGNYAKKNQSGEYSPAWRKSPGEMGRKTVSRRLSKHIPINFNQEQVQAFEEGSHVEFHNNEVEGLKPIITPEPIAQKTEMNGNQETELETQETETNENEEIKSEVKPISQIQKQQIEDLKKRKDDWAMKLSPNDLEEWVFDTGNVDEMTFEGAQNWLSALGVKGIK